MTSDATDPTSPDDPAPPPAQLDPSALKGAHGRTGRMLQHAGLPFEDEEFDESDEAQPTDGSAAAE